MTNFDKKVSDLCLVLAKQIHAYNKEALVLKDKSCEIQKQLSACCDPNTTQNLLSDLRQLSSLLEEIDDKAKNINSKIKKFKQLQK